MPSFSLTQLLIASDAEGYQRATQSPFLRLAAQGHLSKDLLGQWLANDRIYIHSYIKGIGRLLSFLDMPGTVAAPGERDPVPTRLVDWLVDALVNIRREEKFFVSTAADYGIAVDLERGPDGSVPDSAKLEGLRRFETLFTTLSPAPGGQAPLPWLECAVVFYGTEKCYVDAWSWARAQLDGGEDGSNDADGGALRTHFIGNWTGEEFVRFVDQLGEMIDEAVAHAVEMQGEDVRVQILDRAKEKWAAVLAAEQAFWPAVD